MIDTRTRLLAVAGSLVLLLLVVDLVRRRKLKEEYSVLWVTTALGLLVLAAWYQLLDWITTLIGGVALSSTLFFFALLFVFVMLLHFSVRVSALERRLTALIQEIGLLGVRRGPVALPGPAPRRASNGARLAVVIPCHNDGSTIRDAVASVREDEPVEVVVVDDGSDDPATLEVLAELERDGTRVVRQPNGGPGAARTTGMRETSAPFVFPLDADDQLVAGALGELADALESNPTAGFAWGNYVLFGEQTGLYRSPRRWLPWTLTYVNPYPISSMFRRPVLERCGGWAARDYEDWDLWMRLALFEINGIGVDRVVYRRRLHGDGRQLTDDRRRHEALYNDLRRRHGDLFARRGELRRRERPAVWKRAVYPLLFGARKVVPLRVEAFLQRTMMRLGSGLPG
jgi:glycosyltransferase involved in cell wall biosynthesis